MAGSVKKRTRPSKKDGKPTGKKYVVWRARYPDPDKGGTAQIERSFSTKYEAERWLTEQRSAVHRGLHVKPADTEQRVSAVADAWRGAWIDLKPKTKAGYDAILEKHVLPRWANVKVGAVTAEAVQAWVNELAASGREPNTVRNIYKPLRGVMSLAVQRRYITTNPCDAVRLPRRNGKRVEMLSLTAAEVTALAEAIHPHFRVLVYTAAYSGLRAGELGGLRKRDVDTLHGSLNVERTLQEINTTSEHLADDEKGLIIGTTKTDQTRRVGLPRFLKEMLTDHLAALPGGSDAPVFTSLEGGPLRHGNFRRRHFAPAVRKALPPAKHGLRFHDLRHTCASLLIAAGAHPHSIKEHLGHSDIRTTFNVYGHQLPSAREALSAALDVAYEGSAAHDEERRVAPAIG